MFKRITLILLIVLALPTSNALAVDQEEDYPASQMATLKTWVAPKHHNNGFFMKRAQRTIYFSLAQRMTTDNPFMLYITFAVNRIQDPDVKQYFGQTFPFLHDFNTPYLQAVRKESQKGKTVVVEFGCGLGFMSCMTTLALGNIDDAVHYNDLNTTMMTKAYDGLMKNMYLCELTPSDNKPLLSYIEKFPGSWLKALDTKPELIGKVNIILAQNVIHFLNPIESQQSLDVTMQLLKEGGQAFLLAQAIKFENSVLDCYKKLKLADKQQQKRDLLIFHKLLKPRHPFSSNQAEEAYFENYLKGLSESRIDPLPYMGFLEFDVEFISNTQHLGTALLGISNVKRPELIQPTLLSDTQKETVLPNGEILAKQHVVGNSYTPSIFRTAIYLYNLLHSDSHYRFDVIDVYPLDGVGTRQEKYNTETAHVACIIKKVKKEKESLTVNTEVLDHSHEELKTSDALTRTLNDTRGQEYERPGLRMPSGIQAQLLSQTSAQNK